MENFTDVKYILDGFLFLFSGILVMWMAAGFAMVETGLTRSKNGATILTKNIALFAISCLMFYLVGYNLMYVEGNSFMGYGTMLSGVKTSEELGYPAMADFFFQMVFVATAASVISGVVAERMKLIPFLIFIVILSSFIYPIQGHWSWGGSELGGLLNGFSDFAGSTVVHSVGGWAALAGVLILGSRKGKFTLDGKIKSIPGSNLTLATLGTFILWMGWFGFNGGSQLSILGLDNANAVSQIFVNTNTAAAAGLLSAMVYSKLWLKKTILNVTLNGALAGLVVITADPLTPSPEVAILYGALGGLIIPVSMSLLEKWGIDDPVGAISVHGVAGIIGLLLVPILNTDATLYGQLIGTGAIFGFVFLLSLFVWQILKLTIGLRVGEEEELAGSDMWETGSLAYPEFMTSK